MSGHPNHLEGRLHGCHVSHLVGLRGTPEFAFHMGSQVMPMRLVWDDPSLRTITLHIK